MSPALTTLVMLLGAALLLAVLLDLIDTALVVGGGGGFLARRVARATWHSLRWIASLIPDRADDVLSLAGPAILLSTAASWGVGVWVSVSLLVWPWLGTYVVASSGVTPRDFTAAAYFAGYSLTTLGTGDLVPAAPLARVAMVFMAALGFGLLTLVVTYLMSVYSALVRRNALARGLEQRTEGTGEPWRHGLALLTGTDRAGVERDLETLHAGLVDLHESHHAYPVLHYFRFRNVVHSVPWMAFAVLDVVHLIGGARVPDAASTWSDAPAWRQARHGARDLLTGLGRTFLPAPERRSIAEERDGTAAPGAEAAWAEHVASVHRAFVARGVEIPDPASAREAYVAARREWAPWVTAFARHMAYAPEAVMRSRERRS